jgi:hypothetical protein
MTLLFSTDALSNVKIDIAIPLHHFKAYRDQVLLLLRSVSLVFGNPGCLVFCFCRDVWKYVKRISPSRKQAREWKQKKGSKDALSTDPERAVCKNNLQFIFIVLNDKMYVY